MPKLKKENFLLKLYIYLGVIISDDHWELFFKWRMCMWAKYKVGNERETEKEEALNYIAKYYNIKP